MIKTNALHAIIKIQVWSGCTIINLTKLSQLKDKLNILLNLNHSQLLHWCAWSH